MTPERERERDGWVPLAFHRENNNLERRPLYQAASRILVALYFGELVYRRHSVTDSAFVTFNGPL